MVTFLDVEFEHELSQHSKRELDTSELDTKALLRSFRDLQKRQAAEAEHYLSQLLAGCNGGTSDCNGGGYGVARDSKVTARDKAQRSSDPNIRISPMPMSPRESPNRVFRSAVFTMREEEEAARAYRISNLAGKVGFRGCLREMRELPSRKRLPGCVTKIAREVVNSTVFSLASSSIVIANAFVVTHYLDLNVRYSTQGKIGTRPWRQEEDSWDLVFAVLFTVELLLRLMKDELQLFTPGHTDFFWNVMDLLIVICEWLNRGLTASAETGDIDVSVLRTLRILRIFRFVRFIRLLRIVSEVRLITICLLKSVMPLLWSLIFIGIILFVFANAFVIGVETSAKNWQHQQHELIYFCDFPTTMLTLMAVITQGVDWLAVYEEIAQVDPYYGLAFLIFVALMVVGVLNVISSIFIQIGFSKAQTDRELLQANERDRQAELMRSLGDLFRQLHAHGASTITFDEWQRKVTQLDIQASLMRLGLDPARCIELFDLIDVDGNREIDLEEFVAGCLQLMGQAKALDMETFVRSMKIQMVNSNRAMTTLLQNIMEELASYRAATDVAHRLDLSAILKAIDDTGGKQATSAVKQSTHELKPISL